jgi:hypothetical protein
MAAFTAATDRAEGEDPYVGGFVQPDAVHRDSAVEPSCTHPLTTAKLRRHGFGACTLVGVATGSCDPWLHSPCVAHVAGLS